MVTIRTIMVGALLLLQQLGNAQAEPQDLIRTFFTTYSNGKAEKALDDLFGNSKWLEQKADEIHTLKLQFLSLNDIVGDYHGYASLGQKTVANDLAVYDYMVK